MNNLHFVSYYTDNGIYRELAKDLEKSLYINNDVRFKESNIFIKKDEMSRNVINNSSFNRDI